MQIRVDKMCNQGYNRITKKITGRSTMDGLGERLWALRESTMMSQAKFLEQNYILTDGNSIK